MRVDPSPRPMPSPRRAARRPLAARFAGLLGMSLALASPLGLEADAHAGTKAAQEALTELTSGKKPYNVVQNRFFLKANRFEIAPVLGYIPNNPFVKRYIGGVLGAYHFSETFAAEGAFMYAPDLGGSDLKDLTATLVQIANNQSSGSKFRQPLEKMIMGATFAARWAPVYGKINLIGERVLNFDFYGVAGLGMLSINEYYATYDNQAPTGAVPVKISESEKKVKVPVNLGVGMDFFVSSSVAVKLDARSYLYVDTKPQYDPNVPVTESRIYNNFVASTGVSIFFPKMKPRLYDF